MGQEVTVAEAQARSLEHLSASTSQFQSARGDRRGQAHYKKPEYVSSDTAPILPKGRKHTSHICIRAAAGRAVSPSGRLNSLKLACHTFSPWIVTLTQ